MDKPVFSRKCGDWIQWGEHLDARLIAQETALEVAVGALEEIDDQYDPYGDASWQVQWMAKAAREALAQIEGEGEKSSNA